MNTLKVGTRTVAAAIALSLGIASPASLSAATQGSKGATSTGTVGINASVPNRARITGLTDVNFLNADPAVDASDAQDVCVWTNTSSGAYTITATGDVTSGFVLSSTAGTVPYSVEWAGLAGQTSGTALSSGTASSSFNSSATHQTCTTGPASSASLVVSIGNADLATMTAGETYTGTLTLLVTPQ